MEKKKDMLEQHLAENFIELAKEEEQQINHIKNHGSEDDIRMPEGTKEAIRAKLDDEIEKNSKKLKEKRFTAVSLRKTAMPWSVDGKSIQEEKETGESKWSGRSARRRIRQEAYKKEAWPQTLENIYCCGSSARNDGSCWHYCGWRTRTDGHDGQTGSWRQRSRESQLQ